MTRQRATQLRARFVQPGGHLRVIWWISNTALPVDALADDARDELRDVLVDDQLQAAGAEAWRISAAVGGPCWLVLDLPVRAWHDPRRDQQRRATTSH
jgi:hypothetical protein